MDYDIFLAPAADSWKVVKRAEELGFRRAWFYDTQLLNAEVFVSMAAAAMQTSKIRLGTGVLIPSNRIAPVAASGLASLNALAPGRIDFGISTGFTARRTMGLRPVRLGDMEEYVRVVCGLLAGETLEWTFEDKRRKIRFLNPEIGAVNIKDPIPVHVSALGPRARRLTAKLGAGWIHATANVAHAQAAIADMQAAGATRAGTRPGCMRRRPLPAASWGTTKPVTALGRGPTQVRPPPSRCTAWSSAKSLATWDVRFHRSSRR